MCDHLRELLAEVLAAIPKEGDVPNFNLFRLLELRPEIERAVGKDKSNA